MTQPKRGWRWYGARFAVGLFLIALLVLTLVVTTKDDTTNTETALWTFILFALGFGASYYFGRQSVEEAAQDVVRPQAKAAARRLVTLGAGIAAFRTALATHRLAAKKVSEEGDGNVPFQDFDLAFDSLDIQIDLQTKMVIDALEDWRQFDPEIANELIESEGGDLD